jgi:hypothetical protein
MLLVGLIAAASIAAADDPPPCRAAFAGNGLSTLSDPNARLRPNEPNSPASVEVRVPPVLPVTDDPPRFGTVVREWNLLVSLGPGITWRRDSGRFYLCTQGRQMWSVDPLDPPHTARRENWIFPNMGTATADISWSIAWDNDSGCFWISNIVDGNIYGGCYYTRIRKTAVGDTWRWFSENPGDTWLVGDGSGGGAGSMYWMGGSEKCLGRGYFACAPVASGYPYNNVWKFDPYTKSDLGRVACGNALSERGCTLVPYDSNYILTSGWNDNCLSKRDSTGLPLASVPGARSDLALWVPDSVTPDDTVFIYATCGTNSTLQKISVGMLWSQLKPGQAIGEPCWPASAADDRVQVEPNPCQGVATVHFRSSLPTLYSLSLYDATGRVVLSRALSVGRQASSVVLDLRSMPVGVYVLRLNAGTFACSEKIILQH